MAQAALALAPRAVELASVARYRRTADYLAAAQIYLQDNCLLEEPLRPEHVKEPLHGHWGTCPGINLVHAHLNRLVLERDAHVLLVTGPGHGAAANLANQYLDGSLRDRYPEYTLDREGLFRFVRAFGAPGGLPVRLEPGVPGAIHDGSEIGAALAVAFGAALDAPGLIVACIVGDGEAETGPTAAAWHGTKFLDPATGGAVLPILHLNGYKISSPTVYGTMGDGELSALFQGLGWEPLFAEGPDFDATLAAAIDEAHARIVEISGSDPPRPRWPLIVLRSPKGLGGPKRVDGHPVEGSYRSHRVPAGDLRSNPRHLEIVEAWLRSYRPEELFDAAGRPAFSLDAVCPAGERRLGAVSRAGAPRALDLPAAAVHGLPLDGRGATVADAREPAGAYLEEVFRRSEPARNFRIVCADELESSRLGRVFRATGRAYVWPVGPDDTRLRPDGRVMEIASDHVCQGWLQGYLQTGRHGLYVGGDLAASMLARYARWLAASRRAAWREPVASLTAVLVAGLPPELVPADVAGLVRVYLPPDANTLVATLERCLRSTGGINLVVAPGGPLPQWLSAEEAVSHCAARGSVWPWAGLGDPERPEVVVAAAGAVATREAVAAVAELGKKHAGRSVRFVGLAELVALAELPTEDFEALFTAEAPVLLVLDGHEGLARRLLCCRRRRPRRFRVLGEDRPVGALLAALRGVLEGTGDRPDER